MTNVLICGKNSYIGTAFEDFVSADPEISVSVLDMICYEPSETSFEGIDVILFVAGLVHKKETSENAELYYKINRDLPISVAKKAKAEGVKKFIYLSSMSVYGTESGNITAETVEQPVSNYGRSKLEAEKGLSDLAEASFSVSLLRPPMVYGKGCKGNYQALSKFAVKFPFFPYYDNQRSMIYIENLCACVKKIVIEDISGVIALHNSEYVRTSDMVKLIAEAHGKKIRQPKIFSPFIKAFMRVKTVGKVFGSLTYDHSFAMSADSVDLKTSVEKTEK